MNKAIFKYRCTDNLSVLTNFLKQNLKTSVRDLNPFLTAHIGEVADLFTIGLLHDTLDKVVIVAAKPKLVIDIYTIPLQFSQYKDIFLFYRTGENGIQNVYEINPEAGLFDLTVIPYLEG